MSAAIAWATPMRQSPASHHPAEPDPYREPIPLATADAITITTLVDNVIDVLLPNAGPARRPTRPSHCAHRDTARGGGLELTGGRARLLGVGRCTARQRGAPSHPLRHRRESRRHGGNMARLDISPREVEIVVCSHGHFDHTTGLDGFIRRVRRANVPVLIHPEFWTRRRLTIPGRDRFSSRRPVVGRSSMPGSTSSNTSNHPSSAEDRCSLGRLTGRPSSKQVLRTTRLSPQPVVAGPAHPR